ncbi:tRNA dihydrouridine synthase DusB [Bacteroidales bacterium OttesenSCG-928-B11]|nr:tRNA dihydrouridine synthase DusB [Bacteroidales bacterium OttesenSCG-928-E04]MDL2308774.1 tRNA dihydrouridine synthase DusB [Bacteroidales bacterium OttesenSCG-928-C03]MDL2312657.1 tRNA dihydrouridine synthase DusB [Bacteroidales bacterium OttesenSCG-928-B11]MDL2326092.1 tRNA dihydrouridine synthase DusB [Bacteroidales bacterium OttesenSCG-928-A14]
MKNYTELLSQIDFPLYLAPMEGVTDAVFRKICKKYGADFLISEFISSDALVYNAGQSVRKMAFEEDERPFGVQIFGHNEDSLSIAAKKAEEYNPDFIDINWGCPVKKVVSKGAGSAILKDIPKMVRLTKAVVDAVSLPVTVKTRLGWDESDKPIVEAAERLQDIGISAITIHGRTRSQQYGGTADWEMIGKVKANPRLTIPVIGNGDINSGEKAMTMKDRYGVDGIMVGRAAIGNPWIFEEIKNDVKGVPFSYPDFCKRAEVCLNQMEETAKLKGERRAVLEMRLHYGGYFKAIPNFKERKVLLMKALTIDECRKILLPN